MAIKLGMEAKLLYLVGGQGGAGGEGQQARESQCRDGEGEPFDHHSATSVAPPSSVTEALMLSGSGFGFSRMLISGMRTRKWAK